MTYTFFNYNCCVFALQLTTPLADKSPVYAACYLYSLVLEYTSMIPVVVLVINVKPLKTRYYLVVNATIMMMVMMMLIRIRMLSIDFT